MKVRLKESYRQAEEEYHKLPKEEREKIVFWTSKDFVLGKEYEVLEIVKHGMYRIVDESGEDYLYSPGMFDIVEK